MCAGSRTYFTAVNRWMKHGGAFGMSKFDALQRIPSSLIPLGIRVDRQAPLQEERSSVKACGLHLPVVAKPDAGERGKGVSLIEDAAQLEEYFRTSRHLVIPQEYVADPLELGVLFYRYPDGAGEGVTSLMIREFLTVTGDGKATLKELQQKNIRALFRLDYLFEKHQSRLHERIPEEEEVLIEPIGNHNRGNCFLNGNHLINEQLQAVFSEIVNQMEGFDCGRFDLKVGSLDDLYQKKSIKILELNGVNAEPAHIYDPGYGLFHACRDVLKHMHIIFIISRINRKSGLSCDPAFRLFADLYRHLRG